MRAMKFLLVLAVVASISSPAWSSRAFGAETVFSLSLEELINTPVAVASRQDEPYLTSAGTVYVITDREIERYGWHTLREVLESIPGIDIMFHYSAAAGGQRGFEGFFTGTVLLIDGRELINPISDQATFDYSLPASMIKRVEILMGPNSTLYGSQAMEGVINVITKSGDAEGGNVGETQVMVGDAGMREAGAVVRKTTKKGSVGFSAYYFSSDQDWPEVRDFFLSNDGNYLNPTNSVRNRIRDYSKAGYVLDTEAIALLGRVSYRDLYAGFDLFLMQLPYGQEFGPRDWKGNDINEQRLLTYTGFRHQLTDALSLQLEFQYLDNLFNTTTTKARNDSTATSYEDLDTFLLREEIYVHSPRVVARTTYDLNDWNQLTFGYDFKQDNFKRYRGENDVHASAENRTGYAGNPADGRDEHSFFVQDAVTFTKSLRATFGTRLHHEDLIDDQFLPRASVVYSPWKSSAFKMTYGKGFRSRNLAETGDAFQGSGFAPGATPDVDPTTMDMYELNYSQGFELGDVRGVNVLAGYQMTQKERFILAHQAQGAPNDLTVNGVEELVKLYLGDRLSGFLGVRWVDPEKHDIAGLQVTKDTPELKTKAGLAYQFTPWLDAAMFMDWWGEVTTAAETPEGGIQPRTTDGWTTFDLKVGFGPFDADGIKYTIVAYVENLFDEEYYYPNIYGTQVIQFRQPPRTGRIGLRATF